MITSKKKYVRYKDVESGIKNLLLVMYKEGPKY